VKGGVLLAGRRGGCCALLAGCGGCCAVRRRGLLDSGSGDRGKGLGPGGGHIRDLRHDALVRRHCQGMNSVCGGV